VKLSERIIKGVWRQVEDADTIWRQWKNVFEGRLRKCWLHLGDVVTK